jgi:hypothetical protein
LLTRVAVTRYLPVGLLAIGKAALKVHLLQPRLVFLQPGCKTISVVVRFEGHAIPLLENWRLDGQLLSEKLPTFVSY